MIGYISGKFLAAEEGSIIVDVSGVGYSALVSSRVSVGLVPGMPVELYIHTNLRENSLELFGFQSLWEKKIFQALTSVSGVGPRTAIAVLGAIDPEVVLSAIVREDRATLTSVSGIGKKTSERLIIEIADKARKLLAERPQRAGVQSIPASAVAAQLSGDAAGSARKSKKSGIPPQGALASSEAGLNHLDLTDLWNEALAALVNLGYREVEAIAAIKMASAKTTESGGDVSLEKLIMTSLQLMSRGI